VSVRPVGETKLGTRVELKNINSFRFVEKALAYEIARQAAVLDGGGSVAHETRGWREEDGTTFSMRSKEEAQDYRYFPDPDLPPLVIDPASIESWRAEMPELPRAKRERLVRDHGVTPETARVLTSHPVIARFFEEAAGLHGNWVKVANFVQSEVLGDIETHGLDVKLPVTPRQVADILRLVDEGRISGKQAKQVYGATAGAGPDNSPREVVKELGIVQVSDASAIEDVCRQILARFPKQTEQFRAGNAALLGFFVGQVMKETKGAANPQMVNDELRRQLGVT
jgi:aspartyl-tRNA(Asn)/glutamyl-tRNA(Gln) amidotransferase subunit B